MVDPPSVPDLNVLPRDQPLLTASRKKSVRHRLRREPAQMVNRVCREVGSKKNIVVINDEAHHCCRRNDPTQMKTSRIICVDLRHRRTGILLHLRGVLASRPTSARALSTSVPATSPSRISSLPPARKRGPSLAGTRGFGMAFRALGGRIMSPQNPLPHGKPYAVTGKVSP